MTTHNRFEHIDALRAIAAFMVISLHTSELVREALKGIHIEAFINDFVFKFDFGRAGVVLFFAISGFVIPNSLKETDRLVVFPIRRFLRLYPAYWISIITGLFAIHWLWNRPIDSNAMLVNITMLQRFFGIEDVLGLYWTLQVELFFYAVCFLLFVFGLLRNGRTLAVIALILCVYWYVALASGLGLYSSLAFLRPSIDGYYLEWTAYLSIMFLGASWRHLLSRDRAGIWLTLGTTFLWLFVAPMTGYLLHEFREEADAKAFICAKYGSYFIGIWLFFIFGFFIKIRSKTIAWFGRISYSLYLQHPFVMYGLVYLALNTPLAHSLTAGAWVAIVMAGTVIVAGLIFKFIEDPCIKLSYRITKNIELAPVVWTAPRG